MKRTRTGVGIVVLALAAATLGATRLMTASAAPSSLAKPPETVLYGHLRSMTPKAGGRLFELRFDPAWWLTGFTAKRAKLADTGSSDVPNDYYIVEEGHRLLTFLVTSSTGVTVLTGGTVGTAITPAELAQIVAGKNPKHRALSEPKAGYWLRVGMKYPNAVTSLDQQYQP